MQVDPSPWHDHFVTPRRIYGKWNSKVLCYINARSLESKPMNSMPTLGLINLYSLIIIIIYRRYLAICFNMGKYILLAGYFMKISS